jgi:hypothetical protein
MWLQVSKSLKCLILMKTPLNGVFNIRVLRTSGSQASDAENLFACVMVNKGLEALQSSLHNQEVLYRLEHFLMCILLPDA